MAEPPPPTTFLPAAAVIPRRSDGAVLMGARTPDARSYAGYVVFPGGGRDAPDDDLPLATSGADEAAERACALRELGEETGRWLLSDGRGARPDASTQARFKEALSHHVALGDALKDLDLSLDDRRLTPLGRWATDDGRPRQFSVRQFLLDVDDDDCVMTAASEELHSVRWTQPADVEARWATGDEMLLPPIRHVLRCLVERGGSPQETLLEALRSVPPPGAPRVRDLSAGVAVQPFRTPTLPPATHTNTVLLGTGDVLVVDPATPYDDERQRFDELVTLLAASGRRLRAVVLTHHHIDHVSDAERLAERYDLEIWSHRITAELTGFKTARLLEDDEVLETEGPITQRFRVIHTPGHAQGHIALLDDDSGVLVAGDMVASTGSILIDPPEGHMGTYLASLRRLIDSGARRVVPSHGPPLFDGKRRLEEQLVHRKVRQQQVRAALRVRPRSTPRDLVPTIYGADTPEVMYPLAARSVLAALELLVEQGAALDDGGQYTATD